MESSERHACWRLAVIVCFFIVSFCPRTELAAQTQTVRISLSSRSNTNTSYYVAQARGFFKNEGLEVEFIQINPRLGAMDPEMENFLDRLFDKKRPLDEVRDFSFARQAWKELEQNR